jgi:single-strand DNA-binding protein
MAQFNRVIIIGNLTRDPELRQLQSGQSVCRFGLASNRSYRNKQSGETTQDVCFIDIDVWGAQAESCKNYLSKGRSVLVEGRLKFDTWQAPDGTNRSKHAIVAERVVFMQSAAAAEQEPAIDEDTQRLAVQEQTLEQVKQAVAAANQSFAAAHKDPAKGRKKKETGSDELPEMGLAGAGETNLQDEPPFQDDLPF